MNFTPQPIVVRQEQNYGIPDSCVFVNAMGQMVNVCNPYTASGIYEASDQAVEAMNEAGTNICPSGMRPGRVVIKGLPATDNTNEGFIRTCGGRIVQEDMPDIHVVNWRYRTHLNLVLAILIVVMLVAVTFKIFR